MPTFDFQCRKCNHVFEFSRPFGSIELPACTACGSKRTEKLIAPPAVHFKGSGWYKTDSRGTVASPSAAPKKEEKKADDAKTDVKAAETKTAEKKTEAKTEKSDAKKAPDKKS